MAQDIQVIAPNGETIVFPEGTPDDVIAQVMQAEFGGAEDAAFYEQPGLSEANPIDLEGMSREDILALTPGTWIRDRNGNVNALSGNPELGLTDLSATPVGDGVYTREASTADDVAQSLGTGLVQGVEGILALPGGQSYYGNYPSAELITGIRERLTGETYQPQTTAGEYARTIGEFAPGAFAPGGPLARIASVVLPAVASEGAGQATEGTQLETPARIIGGLIGGAPVGITQAVRSGPQNVIRNAAQGVTEQNLADATRLRTDAERLGIALTQAEALQQVTGGATGLGRVQRVVEGSSTALAPMMAQRPAQVRGAVQNLINEVGAPVAPAEATRLGQETAEGVLNTMRRRVNESARPFYDRLPGQSLPPEQYAQLAENPSYARALEAVRNDPELAPLLTRELPMDEATRMLRARQQGFTTEGYRGAAGDAPLFTEGRGKTSGIGTFFSSSPETATTYAPRQGGAVFPILARTDTFANVDAGGRNWSRLTDEVPVSGPSVTVSRQEENDLLEALGQIRGPEYRTQPAINTNVGSIFNDLDEYASTDDLAAWANRQGFGGIRIANVKDRGPVARSEPIEVTPSDTYAVFSPENIRSRFDPFAAPTPDNDLNVVNQVVQQLDTGVSAATPTVFNAQGNRTLASQRESARELANRLAAEASPDYAMARQTVSTGRQAFVDPLKRGPIGTIAGQAEMRPTLPQQTNALFPAVPAEGQADQTLLALQLMGEVNPAAGPALTRQFLATQANELLQDNATGPNQFGGAKLAAALMGNPEQERALLGAIDQAAPFNEARRLAEVLRATGQREAGGSQTAFNAQIQEGMRAGNIGQETVQSIVNPTSLPGRLSRRFDNFMAERNAERLAEILMADPATAEREIRRAMIRRSGGNRVRAGVALTQGGED